MQCNVTKERTTIRVLFTLYVNNKLGRQHTSERSGMFFQLYPRNIWGKRQRSEKTKGYFNVANFERNKTLIGLFPLAQALTDTSHCYYGTGDQSWQIKFTEKKSLHFTDQNPNISFKNVTNYKQCQHGYFTETDLPISRVRTPF